MKGRGSRLSPEEPAQKATSLPWRKVLWGCIWVVGDVRRSVLQQSGEHARSPRRGIGGTIKEAAKEAAVPIVFRTTIIVVRPAVFVARPATALQGHQLDNLKTRFVNAHRRMRRARCRRRARRLIISAKYPTDRTRRLTPC